MIFRRFLYALFVLAVLLPLASFAKDVAVTT